MFTIKGKIFDIYVITKTESINDITINDIFPTQHFYDNILGKDITIIYADDGDLDWIKERINNDPLTECSHPSLMFSIAKTLIRENVNNALEDILNGQHRSIMENFEREPGFDREVWERAAVEVKRDIIKAIKI